MFVVQQGVTVVCEFRVMYIDVNDHEVRSTSTDATSCATAPTSFWFSGCALIVSS